MSHQDHTTLIERYLDHEMSAEEKSDFELKLRSDLGLRDELDLHRQAIEKLKAHESLKDELAAIYQEVKEKKKTNQSRWMAIAASLTIFCTVGLLVAYLWNQPSSQDLYQEFYTPFHHEITLRGDEATATENIMYGAIELYEKGAYEQAKGEFSKLKDSLSTNMTLLPIYLSNCHLQLNEYSDARQVLLGMQDSSNLMMQYRRWYLALTELSLRNLAESNAILKSLKEGGGIYQKEAADLSKALDALLAK